MYRKRHRKVTGKVTGKVTSKVTSKVTERRHLEMQFCNDAIDERAIRLPWNGRKRNASRVRRVGLFHRFNHLFDKGDQFKYLSNIAFFRAAQPSMIVCA